MVGSSQDHVVQPLLKQGQPRQVAQDHVRSGFERLQGQRLHNLSGQHVPVFYHPHREKSVFLCSNGISCVSVCACCFSFCLWALLRRVWLSTQSSVAATEYLLHLVRWLKISMERISLSFIVCGTWM